MCGIFGFIGRQSDGAALAQLAQMNERRGADSTGIYTPKHGIVKAAVRASMAAPLWKPKMDKQTLVLGHTRAATHGSVTKANAHPFKAGSIVGTHNGIISNYAALAREHGFAKPEVDSVAIFETLARTKRQQWAEALPTIDGSIAIAMTDQSNNLILYRRDNPIFVLESNEGLYYSSIPTGSNQWEPIATDTIFTIDSKGAWKSESVEPCPPSKYNWDTWVDEYELESDDAETIDQIVDELLGYGNYDLAEKFQEMVTRLGLY